MKSASVSCDADPLDSRATSLVREAGKPGRPSEFDRERVLMSARMLLEDHGIEALTMRKLADVSGATPTTIYRNIGDRESVLNAVLDWYAATISPPELPSEPGDRVHTIFRHVYEVLDTQRWIVEVLRHCGYFGASALWYAEHTLRACNELGLTEVQAVRVYRQLWSYTLGVLITGAGDVSRGARSAASARKLSQVSAERGYTHVMHFLDVDHDRTSEWFLEGLEAYLTALLRFYRTQHGSCTPVE